MPAGWRVFYEGDQLEITGVEKPHDTWWSHVIAHLRGTLLVNGSWSGSMVEGGAFPAGSSHERIEALGRDGLAPDDILIYIGINDYGWGSVEAQVAAGSAAAPVKLIRQRQNSDEKPDAGMAPHDAAARFRAAYEYMLDLMHQSWPEARIWTSTLIPGRLKGADSPTFPYTFRGVSFDAYNDAIREAASSVASCRLVDAASLGFDYEAADGTHPTVRGMRQIAELYLKAMGASCVNLEREELFCGMRAKTFCDKPCVGCPFARGASNEWYHVCEKQLA